MAEDKSTSQPTDEEELQEPAAEEATTEEELDSPAEELDEEQPQTEPEAPEGEEEQPEALKPSARENLRIREVLAKLKQQPPAQQPFQAQGMDYRQELDADPTVVQQLEADRQRATQEAYSHGLRQAEAVQFHTRLEIDAPKVEAKYPILDKDSPQFNPAAADAINTWYLQSAGFNPQTNMVSNPNVRYSEFVEGIFELANGIAGEKVVKTAQNVAKQVASTGLRPDGSSAKRLDLSKDPDAMTDEELDAAINAGIKTRR